mmetsp:Transcript_15611/g.20347  ORF Transcript_15611/g.20347 Transcript_15611/m.20347 type:complete len:80 (-) Transcript_15611:208-447(-)
MYFSERFGTKVHGHCFKAWNLVFFGLRLAALFSLGRMKQVSSLLSQLSIREISAARETQAVDSFVNQYQLYSYLDTTDL